MRLYRHWLACLSITSAVFGSARSDAGDIEQLDAQWQDLSKRNADAEELLRWQRPQGVRKMSDDPGEKFWPHYWTFEAMDSGNASMASQPFALHLEDSHWTNLFGRALARRDGSCPTGNSPCTSINQPNSCCPTGNVCITVQDTGNGPVGCCPAGQTCGNTIAGCPSGYASCPDSDNKGCCIPGFACSGNICINVGTQTVTPTTSTTSSTSSSTSTVSVVTVTSVNNSGFTTTATVTAFITISPSNSTAAAAPVRPTSSDSAASIAPASVTTSTSTTNVISSSMHGYCPVGYYMCSAVYLGGCCQVDRDCNTTSCPSTASTTIINGSPTVVAPTGVTVQNNCANGWYSCAASLGGNCCPSGYNCGQTDCPASAAGIAAQAKQAPSEAAITASVWSFLLLSLLVGVGMIML